MFSLIRLLMPLALLLGALLASLGRAAHAQPAIAGLAAPAPTREQIDAARKALPSKAELDAAGAALKGQQSIRLPATATDSARQPAPDLSQLASQYDRIQAGPRSREAGERELSGLLVFVSLGMPVASLERVVADAEATGALVVLRGIEQRSMRKTRDRIESLTGTRRVGWQIDPSTYKRFAVTTVPTYVLVDPARPVAVACGQAICQQPAFSKVAGDVSARFALEAIARAEPEFAALAARFVQRLPGGAR